MHPHIHAVAGTARDFLLAAWLVALAITLAHQAVAVADLLGRPAPGRRGEPRPPTAIEPLRNAEPPAPLPEG